MTQRFDELYSVSDLHFGGEEGFQVFDQGETLAKLVENLRARPAERRIALILNGDVCDFLAESNPAYLDPLGAVAKLERIMDDPAFRPAWEALATYVRTPERHLVIALGNHDVELALPRVRECLAAYLCGDDAGARGRLDFAMDGAGFLCQVGGGRVLCTHGNEVDNWNVVDHELLGKVAAATNRMSPPPAWESNAGTRLVIDIMNQVKGQYRWVDLLKPEVQGVVPIMLALAPEKITLFRHFARVGLQLAKQGARQAGFLSTELENEAVPEDPDAALLEMVGDTIPELHQPATHSSADLLSEVEDLVRADTDGDELVARDDEMLGLGDVWNRLKSFDRVEAMRLALGKLVAGFEGFRHDTADDTFTRLDEEVGPDVDFLIAGHTHMHKALERKNGSGFYLNSGTWIRLMRLAPELLEDRAKFEQVWDVLADGSMPVLDAATVEIGGETRSLVKRRPSVVCVWEEGGAAHGELRSVNADTGEPMVGSVQEHRFTKRRG